MNNTYAPNESSPMTFPIYGILLLVLVALVLGASTVISHRRLSWKASLTQGLGSLLWASPVIALLACVAWKVIPHFQFRTTANYQRSDTEPSWFKSNGVGTVQSVPTFSNNPETLTLDPTSDAIPGWVDQKVQRLNSSEGNPQTEAYRLVLESDGWYETSEAAREDLANQTAKLVQEDFSRFHRGGSSLPLDKVKSQALKSELVTHRMFSKESDPYKMYKVYWQIELSPKVRTQLEGTWKEEVAVQRAWLLGGVFGLLTLIAGTFALYFHLDEKTSGEKRFRLKLAATALMSAGTLGLLAALPMLSGM